ncbi:MAG TPA: carboxymuconolactone decarboxylase family protein, partial [Anaerolineae bacterium]|nr:carboxymuconolactone decarboxylase family protein [Anaerolineae bacterium]
VNQCRYCTYYHVKESLAAGLPEEEIRQLQDGIVDDAPAEELPALLYAQHWAETDAKPDPAMRQKLYEIYGDERAEAIETILRMIRMGNLWGNTADYLLYKLSFGHKGLTQADQQPQMDTRITQI